MAVLANITVGTTQLQEVKTNITDFYYDGETDFASFIERVKIEVFTDIKLKERDDNPTKTDAELNTLLATIKDLPEEKCLERKIAALTVAAIMQDVRFMEEAEAYKADAKAIPLLYYIDEDADSVVDDSEYEHKKRVSFGR